MTYSMKISKRVLQHLGIQLYDTIPAVLAEFISNSYDADAKRVDINFYDADNKLTDEMFGKFLSLRNGEDRGYRIEITDNGHGMTPEELNTNFLMVGRNKRLRDNKSSPSGRAVTGNKGIGKLAAFGVCKTVEVISSGGKNNQKGYHTGHVILKKDAMLSFENEEDYKPNPGNKNSTYENKSGTKIILKDFEYKKVLEKDMLIKNLLSRFGETILDKCTICINDKIITLEQMPSNTETKISFHNQNNQSVVKDYAHKPIDEIKAFFECDGKRYSVTGWVSYSLDPIKIDSLLGIRILCKGKIATKTRDFNFPSGYTGEYNNKSYIMGELSADWLDEDEDMISTDRNSITWSNPICAEFQVWGQQLIKYISKKGKPSIQKKHQLSFFEKTDFENNLLVKYPSNEQSHIRERATKIAKMISSNIRKDDLEDKELLDRYVELSLFFAPHMALDDSLTEIGMQDDIVPDMITKLLLKTEIADLASYGRIAKKHVDVIQQLEKLTVINTKENELQDLLESAPWLISANSTPISQNSALKTFQDMLNNFFAKPHNLMKFPPELENKRPDFVFLSQSHIVEIIEIKKAFSIFGEEDFQRLHKYVLAFKSFFKNEYKEGHFSLFKIVLVCQDVKLQDTSLTAYEKLTDDNILKQISWGDFLANAKSTHRLFLDEFEKNQTQKSDV